MPLGPIDIAMSKGYPAPRAPREEVIPQLLPEEVCLVCKRRPRAKGDITCAECSRALDPA